MGVRDKEIWYRITSVIRRSWCAIYVYLCLSKHGLLKYTQLCTKHFGSLSKNTSSGYFPRIGLSLHQAISLPDSFATSFSWVVVRHAGLIFWYFDASDTAVLISSLSPKKKLYGVTRKSYHSNEPRCNSAGAMRPKVVFCICMDECDRLISENDRSIVMFGTGLSKYIYQWSCTHAVKTIFLVKNKEHSET